MTASADLIIRVVCACMVVSVICGFAVFRMRQPYGFRAFWTDSPGGFKRGAFYIVLLLACWLLPFSLVAVVVTGIPFFAEPLAAARPGIRLGALFAPSTLLWLVFYWHMLKSAPV